MSSWTCRCSGRRWLGECKAAPPPKRSKLLVHIQRYLVARVSAASFNPTKLFCSVESADGWLAVGLGPGVNARHHGHVHSPHPSSLHLTLPFLTSPHLTSPILTSPHLSSPLLTSPHLNPPHLTSPLLTSPHLTPPHLTSPAPHLRSPRLT